MKRLIYLFPVFVFILSLSINGCEDDNKGACVTGSGIGRRCGDNYTHGQCELINGTLYLGQTCAELGFGKATAYGTSIDSTGDRGQGVNVDSSRFDEHLTK